MGREARQFLFVGNHPCLDLVNTQMIIKGELTDLLMTFEDYASWLVQAKLLTRSQAQLAKAGLNDSEAQAVLGRAKELRATLRAVVERIALRQSVPDAAIETINLYLARRPGFPQLVRTKGGFEQRFHSIAAQAEDLVVPLAEAACRLLSSAEPPLIKKCRNAACILYFYDTTKNHGRNWCSMELCGNRMKVAAYFQRQRKRSKP